MVYTEFTADKPVITDTGAQVVDFSRTNLMALRDAIVCGTIVGWNMSQVVGGGSTDEPDEIWYSNDANTEAIRLDITWGTTGGEDGNPTVVDYYYTADDTPTITWEKIGRQTLSYNSNGTLTSTTWSAIP